MKRNTCFCIVLFVLSNSALARVNEGKELPVTAASSKSGVTFIDGESTDEKVRRYLLPVELIDPIDTSDLAFYEFIHEKIQWENSND